MQADLIVVLWIVVLVHILWTWVLAIRRGRQARQMQPSVFSGY